MIIDPKSGLSVSQEVVELPWSHLKALIDIEGLMKARNWGIHCTQCSRIFGPPGDGVRFSVSEDGRTVEAECGHQKSRYTTEVPVKF